MFNDEFILGFYASNIGLNFQKIKSKDVKTLKGRQSMNLLWLIMTFHEKYFFSMHPMPSLF